jgi:phytanoyl-CoA hydroxylase
MVQVEMSAPVFDSDSGGGEEIMYLFDAMAVVGGVRGFAAVGETEVAQFHDLGCLVIEDAFSPQEVDDAQQAIVELIDGQREGFRGLQFEASARELLPTLSAEAKQDHVRKLSAFVEYDGRLKALAEHPQLIALLDRLMGEPPELFQDIALLKPPLVGREKPWHQDNAFFNLPPETTVIGVWIALDEALIENGCMHVIPGSQNEGPVIHWKRRDWQICDTDVQTARVVAVPLRPGSLLFFHGLLHHGTPPSRSPRRRRAVQYHYKPASVERISGEEHRAIFGSEGKDVEC